MNLELDKKQFETLLKLVYLGNWMANGTRDGNEDDPSIDEYDEMENFIFKVGYENGFKKIITYEKDIDLYDFTKDYLKNEIHKLIYRFNDDTLWEELSIRLAIRDAVEEVGESEFLNMDREKKMSIISEKEDFYNIDFAENGIENLRLIPKPKPKKELE